MRTLVAASIAVHESGIKGHPTPTDNAATTAQNKRAVLTPIRIRAILKLQSDARASGDPDWERRRGEGEAMRPF